MGGTPIVWTLTAFTPRHSGYFENAILPTIAGLKCSSNAPRWKSQNRYEAAIDLRPLTDTIGTSYLSTTSLKISPNRRKLTRPPSPFPPARKDSRSHRWTTHPRLMPYCGSLLSLPHIMHTRYQNITCPTDVQRIGDSAYTMARRMTFERRRSQDHIGLGC